MPVEMRDSMKFPVNFPVIPENFGMEWPQRLLDEAMGCLYHDGLTMHSWMAVWPQAVAPAQCNEQLPRPEIRDREF